MWAQLINAVKDFLQSLAVFLLGWSYGSKKGRQEKGEAESKLIDAELKLELERNAREADKQLDRSASDIINDAISEARQYRDKSKSK